MAIRVIGLDIAKSVFQVHEVDEEHYGRRPHRPHQQAGHVTAPDQCCRNVRKFLPGRPPHRARARSVLGHRLPPLRLRRGKVRLVGFSAIRFADSESQFSPVRPSEKADPRAGSCPTSVADEKVPFWSQRRPMSFGRTVSVRAAHTINCLCRSEPLSGLEMRLA